MSDTIVTYYWAPWCTSCKTVGPMLEKLCKERGIELNPVNADESVIPPILASYTSLPIVFVKRRDGESSFAGASVTVRTMSDHIY